MLRGWLPLAFLFVLFTGSCSEEQSSVDVIQFQPSNYQVLLYTDKTKLDVEEQYIDAILELKAQYPDQLKDITIQKKNLSTIQQSSTPVHDYPTLLIIKKGRTVSKVTGNKNKHEILSVLRQTVQNQ